MSHAVICRELGPGTDTGARHPVASDLAADTDSNALKKVSDDHRIVDRRHGFALYKSVNSH